MKAVFAVLSIVLLAACATKAPSAPTGPVDAQVVLAPGQTTDVAAAGIQIRFETVVDDSRCPGDATCIRAGDATIRISVLPSVGGPVAIDLNTNNVQPGRYSDLKLALENLSPYPFASRPHPASDYRATIRITRS